MTKCANCGTMILAGGKQEGALKYCGTRCWEQGMLATRSRQLPQAEVQQQLMAIHQGLCPKCQGSGPVDVHVSHRVMSALIVTTWRSRPQICCQSCGNKARLGDSALSLALGWWGIPWGLVMTPIQIGRNLVGLARPVDPSKPSSLLETAVRVQMAAKSAAAASQSPARQAA